MKKCPFCAEEIPDYELICTFCGQDVDPDLPQERRIRCPYCAEWIRKDTQKCPYCESKLSVSPGKEQQHVVDGEFRCEQCGCVIEPSIVICPNCGKFTGTRAYDKREKPKQAKQTGRDKHRTNPWPLIGVLAAIVLIWIYALSDNNNNNSTPIPTSTRRPPTATQRHVAIPTIPSQNLGDMGCVHWSKVTHKDVEKELCVYGIVLETEHAGDSWFAYFSRNTDSTSSDFRLYAINAWYTNVYAGDCIALTGKVRSYGEHSFVFINPTSPSVGGDVRIYNDSSMCDK